MYPRNKPLTAAIALALLGSAHAQTSAHLAPIFVTATRFNEHDVRVPANISVISRNDILSTPARDLPGVLKSRAGVSVSALYGSLGTDSTIDMRGFGETGGANTLILLDGQRLNPIDSGAISWSAVPLDSIERIEILRGAGTVLYGDRATGGVVNIITRKVGKPEASVTLGAGSHDTRTIDAHVAAGNASGYINAFGHYAATNGWRDNAQSDQMALSGRAGLYIGQGEGFVDYAVYKDSSGLPGYLLSNDYASRPRHSRTPDDRQRRDGYRLRPGIALPLTADVTLEAEAALDHQDNHARYLSFGSRTKASRDNWSLTPRLRWQHGLGGLASETVTGIDHYSGEVDAYYSTAANQGAKQKSTGYYLQNTTDLTSGWAVTLGARHQQVEQSARQGTFTSPFGTQPAMRGTGDHSRNAWDIGLNYAGQGWRLYGKVGTTFRFANTDELFGYDPMTGNPVFAGDIKPQQGRIQELGGSLTVGAITGRAAVYHMRLEDEIAYDGALFANVNLDPTRRQGAEIEVDWRIHPSLLARLSYAYTDATFRSGPYEDKQIPLVAQDRTATSLTWDGGAFGKYSAIANYTGKRHFSGDYANQRKLLAGYTTVDVMASWNFKPWSISARLINAFDKRYSSYAGYSTFAGDYYYYPADGRNFLLTASYQFH